MLLEPTIIQPQDKPWLPMPPGSDSYMKVLIADERLRQVVYIYRVAPGTKSEPHRHYCYAVAYTIRGEWSYETGPAPEGALVYEPEGSEHTFRSDAGTESIVFLKSDTDRFIETLRPDGSVVEMNMAFFKALEQTRPEDVASLLPRFIRPGAIRD